MDRPDAVGHFRRRCGVSSSAQGRHAGTPGRDALRRRGKRIFVNIDDFSETLPGETAAETASASEVAAQLQSLPARQRDVLQAIAVDSASIKDTAAKFAMSE